jgi:hypothetical protein
MSFKCTNKECKGFDKPIGAIKGSYGKTPFICKGCKKNSMAWVDDPNYKTGEPFDPNKERKVSVGIMSFNSKSPTERRDIINKRAEDHYSQRDKDYKHHKQEQAIKGLHKRRENDLDE